MTTGSLDLRLNRCPESIVIDGRSELELLGHPRQTGSLTGSGSLLGLPTATAKRANARINRTRNTPIRASNLRNAVRMPAETAYHDELGDHFAKNAGTSPYNAYTDRPAMLALAGDVAGLRILDVGCGAGHYAAELLARGAEVIGIDGSATLLSHARDRLGDRAELRLHDAEEPLDFLDDASLDGALCALMLHHVANRAHLLGELHRILRPGGWLLVSTTHPTADWRHFGGSYYDHDWVDLPLAASPFAIHYQRMPLETFLGELLAAGFILEKLVEPRPTPDLREIDETTYNKLNHAPSFLAVRLLRP